MRKTKKILADIGIYLLFFVLVTLIGYLLGGSYLMGKWIIMLPSVLVEIIIFTLIAVIFFKKRFNTLWPLVIGITAVVSIQIYLMVLEIKTYNSTVDLINSVIANPEKYPEDTIALVSMFINTTASSLSEHLIYWILKTSEFVPILMNSIFLMSYWKSKLNKESRKDLAKRLFKGISPVIAVILYFGIFQLIGKEAPPELLLNIILFGLDVYFVTCLSKKKIQVQKETIEKKRYKYLILPIVVFSLMSLISGFTLLSSSGIYLFLSLFILVSSIATVVLLFISPYKASILGIFTTIVWALDRFLTILSIYDSETVTKFLGTGILFSIGIILISVNILKIYRKDNSSQKDMTLKELFDERKDHTKENTSLDWEIHRDKSRKIQEDSSRNKPVVSRFIIWGLSISLFILIWIGVFSLLGFRINKDYFTYDENICIKDNWIGNKYHDGIDDCIYWARYNDLTKDRNLEQEWNTNKDSLINCPSDCLTPKKYGIFYDISPCDYNPQVICDYSDYVDYIHFSNKDYLKSEKKDSFFQSCVNKICKRPSFITVK